MSATLMPISEQDENFIEGGLQALSKAIAASSDFNHDQVREYIYVHEFGLALDLLAAIQLEAGIPLSAETRALFEALAQKMGITDGDLWTSVAELRKT